MLADHLVDDVEAPPNYSLEIAESPTGRGVRRLHVLYRANSKIVRARDPRRVAEALFGHLGSHVPPSHHGLLPVACLALVSDRGAVLAPAALAGVLDRVERPLRDRGMRVIDLPWVNIDPATAELVYDAPPFSVSPAAWLEFDRLVADPRAAERRPEHGRYPLLHWSFLTGPGLSLRRSEAVFHASGTVVDLGHFDAQASLDALARVLSRIPATAMSWGSPRELASALAADQGQGGPAA